MCNECETTNRKLVAADFNFSVSRQALSPSVTVRTFRVPYGKRSGNAIGNGSSSEGTGYSQGSSTEVQAAADSASVEVGKAVSCERFAPHSNVTHPAAERQRTF